MKEAWEDAYTMLRFERRGRILTIVLDDPERLNAVNPAMHHELARVFLDAADDAGSDIIVLTGAGRAFSAGGDLVRMKEVARAPATFLSDLPSAKRVIFSLLDLEKPIVARINGPAVGLGATLALCCDVSFMADTAKIGDPHVAAGLVAGDGGAAIWPQLVGFARAKEYLMTGDLLDGSTAEKIGLVNHCVPAGELDQHVDAFCDRLAAGATRAIRWTKTVANAELKRIAGAALDAGLAYEALSVHSKDHGEAVDAFLEKRRPNFTGE
ncbi:enoyl-CoA hydratase/isomerase family protein [Amorphus sp. 3PC139-8]|uniref:enoyl-CoA hydratase/isomerase family protein n=1 Tax=Amorphus sp. 3PC139-8 TaxID=2735676 RepID=UPI00345D3148